jgi:hypothetical protein
MEGRGEGWEGYTEKRESKKEGRWNMMEGRKKKKGRKERRMIDDGRSKMKYAS